MPARSRPAPVELNWTTFLSPRPDTGTAKQKSGPATYFPPVWPLYIKDMPAHFSEWRLRPAGDGDFEAMWQLDQICFSEEIRYSREELRDVLNMAGCRSWVLEIFSGSEPLPGEIAGYVTARAGKQNGHLMTLDVAPDWRRQGAGGVLLRRAEDYAAGRGLRKMLLEVGVDNHPARAFYQRAGYRELRLLSDYYAPGVHGMLMEKMLENSFPAIVQEQPAR